MFKRILSLVWSGQVGQSLTHYVLILAPVVAAVAMGIAMAVIAAR